MFNVLILFSIWIEERNLAIRVLMFPIVLLLTLIVFLFSLFEAIFEVLLNSINRFTRNGD